MNHPMNPLEFRISSGDLIAELKSRAHIVGLNEDSWPGLTIYRFESPAAPEWEEVRELHLCVIAQGRKCVKIDGEEHFYDPFTYLAIPGNRPFETTIIEASKEKPFLSFGLRIEPELVREVSADILEERRLAAFTTQVPSKADQDAFFSALDRDMMDAILRFLRSLANPTDRRVLAPTYLKEIVYKMRFDEASAKYAEFGPFYTSYQATAAEIAAHCGLSG